MQHSNSKSNRLFRIDWRTRLECSRIAFHENQLGRPRRAPDRAAQISLKVPEPTRFVCLLSLSEVFWCSFRPFAYMRPQDALGQAELRSSGLKMHMLAPQPTLRAEPCQLTKRITQHQNSAKAHEGLANPLNESERPISNHRDCERHGPIAHDENLDLETCTTDGT